MLLWLFDRDEGEIFGKVEKLDAPGDLQKYENVKLDKKCWILKLIMKKEKKTDDNVCRK